MLLANSCSLTFKSSSRTTYSKSHKTFRSSSQLCHVIKSSSDDDKRFSCHGIIPQKMTIALYLVFLAVSLLGRVLARDIEPLDIQHGHFPTEVMMHLYDYEDLCLKDTLALASTCRAFYTALTSPFAREKFWNWMAKNVEFGSFHKRIRLIRFLRITDFEKKKFGEMELTQLFAFSRRFAYASKWKYYDEITDYITGILAERLSVQGNLTIPLSGCGPVSKVSQQECVKKSVVLAVFENAHFLPSFSLMPCRLGFSRVKMMYSLLGWRYVWRFIEPIPMWAGILAYITTFFHFQPSPFFNPLSHTPSYIIFMFSLITQVSRFAQYISNR